MSNPKPQRHAFDPRKFLSRSHLVLLLLCALGLALPRFHAEQSAPPAGQAGKLDVYLLIGDSDMGGLTEIPEDAGGTIERCLLLNGNNGWEPASNPLNRHSSIGGDNARWKLGPGYGFARRMLEKDKAARIGLIVNAGDSSGIDAWLGKSELYRGARKRAKAAQREGTLRGVIWLHDVQGAEEGYLEKLQSLIGNLRTDLGDPNLPFVTAQIRGSDALNARISKLPEATHATGCALEDGLAAAEGVHLDAKSQIILGERLADRMIEVQSTLPAAPRPPSDIRFIDPHVHAMSVTPLGLRAVAKWMDERNVERCIVSPLNHKGSRPQNEEERAAMLANFQPYKGRIHRMAIIDPGEVGTVDEAVEILKREIADGAVGFGEHYGRDLMFDDPKNLMLYEACERVGLPVMFHIDQNKNMVEPGMERVDRVLKMFPKCKVVAHAYWWRQLQHADRQLQEHPNLYADMSGHVVVQVLNRDRKFAREFLIRNQDKILWATDEGWWSFGSKDRQMNQHYTFFEELDLPDEVRHKIYRGNAERVYGLK